MKLLLTKLFILLTVSIAAQIGYSPVIDSLIAETNDSALSLLNRQLSGDTTVMIDGEEYTIATRFYSSTGNEKAAEWIYEQFENLGYEGEYWVYDHPDGVNVIATKSGVKYPNQYFIICAHYDNMPPGDLAPGADDNASGVCAVLEAARLLEDFEFPYTIKFIAFDEEEIGLVGSSYYANYAANNNDSILGVINLDMIAWDSDNDYEYSISTNQNSIPLKDDYVNVQKMYLPEMSHNIISTSASDHSPFWSKGYKAILSIEDWNDFNNFYHTVNDDFSILNINYFVKMTRLSIAALASLAWDFKMDFEHEPLVSENNTEDRTAKVFINSSHETGTEEKEPRLYYRINGGDFFHTAAAEIVEDTFYFTIPGQATGSYIEYYIAAQDQESLFVSSLPAGAKGIDPPGEIPPMDFFSYFIADVEFLVECSQNTPKPIYNLENLYDSININTDGYLLDIDVILDILHSYDGDLKISLFGPDGNEVILSEYNGGSGNHYDNTVFNDEAQISITDGEAPFNGEYKPQEPLSLFDQSNINGNWVLNIYDNNAQDPGNLVDWCIELRYTDDITSVFYETSGLNLKQNYPNPVSSVGKIGYSLSEKTGIEITIFNINGQKIKTLVSGIHQPGDYIVSFSVNELKSGQYFYRLKSNKEQIVKPLMIIK